MAGAPGAAARGAALDGARPRADPARRTCTCRCRRTSPTTSSRACSTPGSTTGAAISPVTDRPRQPRGAVARDRAAARGDRGARLRAGAAAADLPGVRRRPRALGRSARSPGVRSTPTPPASPARTAGPPGAGHAPALRSASPRDVRPVAGALAQVERAPSSTRTTSPRSSRRAAPTSRACSPPPTSCGGRSTATTVSYVVTRNVNYTNVCYFRCGFCAFSKGKLAANLRGKPYVVPLERDRPPRREAWERGAVEICLQGGIHPAFTGETYLEICRGGEGGAPGPARARLLGARGLAGRGDARPAAPRLPRRASATRASPRSPARRPRSSTTRCGARSARTRSRPASGSRCTTPPTGSACARRRRSCSARRGPAQLGAAPARAARPAEAHAAASPSSCRCRSCTWRRRSTSRAAPGRGRRSARRCSCTRSAGSRCTPGSRTCRPRG